ncbi:MAG TPA: hypothetical protein ENJ10_06315 [Caldithrix abyssi]|uniref:Cytochrome b561 bacterial/Ni-hydrogenase domain-containing protein n=1 Tax=Caldithrix abyssi TaxID=187145 RepID=A0A7V1LLN0_CALAY|nr:hypothetical protein [Caldithrix abyssi]
MTEIKLCQLEKALQHFDQPLELTAAEKDQMRQRKMKKHDVAIMLVHWFNASTWLLMLVTGAGLIVSGFYKFAPDFFINIVRGIFGSPGDLIEFHIWLGVLWIAVFMAYTIFGYRKYLRKLKIDGLRIETNDPFEKFKRFQCALFGNPALCLDKNDLLWLKIRVLGILGRSDEPLPPQGSFNAGQKLYGLLVALMTPVIMVTGLIMAFHLGPIWLIQWAIPFHFLAVGLVVSGLMIHVYMGAVFPEEKPAFFSMISGNVSELFLYKHHFNYWKERIVKQCEWRKQTEPDVRLTDLLPNSLAQKVLEKVEELGDVEEEQPVVESAPKPYWNPYLTGALLGLLMLFTFFMLGRGVGASSALARLGVFLENLLFPDYVLHNPAWSRYVAGGKSPLLNFMTFEVIGVIIGGYLAGRQGRRVKLEILKGPNISNGTRLFFSLFGGIFMGLGARIARGCTSGLALVGGATMTVGGWVFMITIFAVGFVGAYLLRRLWL